MQNRSQMGICSFSTKMSFHRLGHFAVEERGPFSVYKPLTQSRLLCYSFFLCLFVFRFVFLFFHCFFFLTLYRPKTNEPTENNK